MHLCVSVLGPQVTCADASQISGLSYDEHCKATCYNSYGVTSYRIDQKERSIAGGTGSYICECDVNNCGGQKWTGNETQQTTMPIQQPSPVNSNSIPCSTDESCQHYLIQQGVPQDQLKYYNIQCQNNQCSVSIEIK